MAKTTFVSSETRYFYPDDVSNYAHMSIIVKNGDYPLELFLPIPSGFPIGDTLAYGSTNLGQIGKIGQSVLNKIQNSDESGMKAVSEGIGNGFKEAANSFKGKNNTVKAAALTQLANKAGLVPTGLATSIAEAAMYNQGAVLNPNQVTTFNGSNTRSYQFEFKFVATSYKQAYDINQMITKLRLNAYPKGDDIILEYPAKFSIQILNKNGNRNTYYAPIYECFLMSITTNYNTTGNAFYENGQPLEVTLGLGFQEVKALTRNDLEQMYDDLITEASGSSEY